MLREVVPNDRSSRLQPLPATPNSSTSSAAAAAATPSPFSPATPAPLTPAVASTLSTTPSASSYTAEPDSEWVALLREESFHLPPLFLHSSVSKLHGGLGITAGVRPVMYGLCHVDPSLPGLTNQPLFLCSDDSIFMKISKSVNDPLFLYRPKRFTKQGKEKDAEVPTCYGWTGKFVHFMVDLFNPLSEPLQVEGIAITLQPTIVKIGDRGRVDISTPSDVKMEDKDAG